jgi:four helix bundle protein
MTNIRNGGKEGVVGRDYRGKNICDRTREYALVIIELSQSIERTATGRVLMMQLVRSGTSMGANVAEAQSAQSAADFVSKMSIALKEARETHYWLALISESRMLSADHVAAVINETDEIIRVLYAIIHKTKQRLR